MKLVYNFDDYIINGCEMIPVKIDNFVYEVDEVGDEQVLKEKYYKKALELAAYKIM